VHSCGRTWAYVQRRVGRVHDRHSEMYDVAVRYYIQNETMEARATDREEQVVGLQAARAGEGHGAGTDHAP